MKVLIADPISKLGLSILSDSGLDLIIKANSSLDEKLRAVKDVDGIIIRSGTKVDYKMLQIAKRLKVIGRAGVGIDNIELPAATRKGIVVMNTPDVNTISAAEHTIALMLTLARNIHLGHSTLMDGKWNRHNLIGTELRNKKIGILGLGKIGKEVMDRCLSFGMEILGFDPFVNQDLFSDKEIKITSMDEVLSESDFITLHMPLNSETKNLFNYDRFIKMKSTASIINVARGGIINENDLARVLNEGVINGAAIDVFDSEPLSKNSLLFQAKNILLSPHLGASTKEAKEGVSKAICEQVRDYLNEQKLTNVVNMPISSLSVLKEIQPFLDLGELLGNLISQLNHETIDRILIECQGNIEEIKPISLATLKGILSPNLPDRVNYINAEAIAKELGFNVEVSYSNVESNYNNRISLKVITESKTFQLDGSIFDDMKPRLINVLGRRMEVTPKGIMLFIENIDVPGVIGKVGKTLGDRNINIAAYLLNRSNQDGKAFAVVRVDNEVKKEDMFALEKLEEVEWIECVNVNT